MNIDVLAVGSVAVASVLVLSWPTGSGFGFRGAGNLDRGPRRPVLISGQRFVRLWALLPSAMRSRRGATGALVALTCLAIVSVQLGLVMVGLVIGSGWFERRRAVAHSRRLLDQALPESIDLCTVVLGSGGTIRDCLDALAANGPLPVRPLASAAVDRASGSERLDQALRWLQLELGPSFQPLTGALLLATEQGGSVGVLLGRLAVEANASRRRLGELAAKRLPVALLIPLVVCSLPAVIVGTVVPLALVSFADLDL